MVKIEVKDGRNDVDIDGNGLEIAGELINGLAGIYAAFESEAPKTGRILLEYVQQAIDDGAIEDAAIKMLQKLQ